MVELENSFEIDLKALDEIILHVSKTITSIYDIIALGGDGRNSIFQLLKDHVMVKGVWADDYAAAYAGWWDMNGYPAFEEAYERLVRNI